MALVAIGVTLGAQDSAGIVPTTASDVGGSITSAQAALAALNTQIGTVQSAITSGIALANTATTDALSTATELGTAVTDLAAVQARATIVADSTLTGLLNTFQSVFNTLSADILAWETASEAVVAQFGSISADATALTALENTVSTDLVDTATALTSGDVFVQCDTSAVTHIGQLSGAFQSALAFAQAQSIVPA